MKMKTTWALPGFGLSLNGILPDVPASESLEVIGASFDTKTRNGSFGFYDCVGKETDLSQMHQMTQYLRRDFEGAVILGIGGSYLGPAAIIEGLRPLDDAQNFPIAWVSNADARTLSIAKKLAREKNVATIVISKSGNTVETLSAFCDLSDDIEPKGIVAITDPNSGTLRELARQNRWQSLEVPPNVGGRFSVLTAVGLFPALLGGVDAEKLLDGARKTKAHSTSWSENAACWFAYWLYQWDVAHKHPVQYLMPYYSGLTFFAQWYVQLFAESLGKKGGGPTPIAALGTSDQHSQLQLWKEGPRDKVIGFLDVLSTGGDACIQRPPFDIKGQESLFAHTFDEINHLASVATEKSLQNSNVPTYRITLSTLSAETLGALFFFFETACAFAGELYGVDAFDQPGVEEAKRLLWASLSP